MAHGHDSWTSSARAEALAHEKMGSSHIDRRHIFRRHPMDIEHINALGAQISDLTQRTLELRRYL